MTGVAIANHLAIRINLAPQDQRQWSHNAASGKKHPAPPIQFYEFTA
jgi:hypothetical protein